MIVEQHEINKVIDKMKAVGLTPPTVENKEALVRFHTEGHMKNSCYYFLTEGIRENKSSYLIASFGCFDKGISEYLCTLHEKLEGVDNMFYCSSFDKHKHTIKKQKAIYLDEISNAKQKLNNYNTTDNTPLIGKPALDNNLPSNNQEKDISHSTINTESVDKRYANKDGFVFYRGFDKARNFLSDSEQLSYLNSIINYGLNGMTTKASPQVQGMLELIKPNLDANFKKWKNSSKGGRPKKVKDT